MTLIVTALEKQQQQKCEGSRHVSDRQVHYPSIRLAETDHHAHSISFRLPTFQSSRIQPRPFSGAEIALGGFLGGSAVWRQRTKGAFRDPMQDLFRPRSDTGNGGNENSFTILIFQEFLFTDSINNSGHFTHKRPSKLTV